MTRFIPATALLFIAVSAIAVACDSTGTAREPNAEPSVNATARTGLIAVYRGAAELGGEEIAFDSLLGSGRPVVLNFWAAQCPPCRVEMPWFQTAYERHRGEVLFVGLDVGPFVGLGSHAQARALLDELAITYPTARAIDETLLRRYELLAMPSTVFFRADGSVLRTHAGLMTQREIDESFLELTEPGG